MSSVQAAKQFKRGDRVRVIHPQTGDTGRTGTVVGIRTYAVRTGIYKTLDAEVIVDFDANFRRDQASPFYLRKEV